MTTLFDLLPIRAVSADAYLAYYEKIAADPGLSVADGQPNYMGGYSPAQLFIEPDLEKSVPVRDDDEKRGGPGLKKSEGPRSGSAPRSSETLDSDESQLYGDRTKKEEVRRVSWQHELALMGNGQHAVITGPPGQGKSVLSRMSAARQASESHEKLKNQSISTDAVTLPIFASLPRLCDFQIVSGESPADTLRRALMTSIKSFGVKAQINVARMIADCAHEERVWLWLDALDEVGDEKREQLHLILSALETWQCRVVITSRPYGLTKWPLPFRKQTLTEYQLAPFLPHQSKAFVDKRFEENLPKRDEMREALQKNHSLQLFAQNPFLLTLGCQIIETGAVIHDDMTRGQLYEAAITTMFPSPQRANDWFPMLCELAWTMQAQSPDNPHIADGDLVKAMGARDRETLCPLADESESLSPVRRLAKELSKLRLLVPSGKNDVWVWPHRSIGEYLAGRHMAAIVKEKGWERAELKDPDSGAFYKVSHWLDRKAWLDSWADTIAFAAGRLRDPSPLLEMLADAEQDDDFRHRLALACRCIPEIDGSKETKTSASPAMDAITTESWELIWRDGKQPLADISPLWGTLGGVMRTNCRIDGKPARNILVDVLNDRDLKIMNATAAAIGKLGAAAATPEVVSALVRLLRHENSEVRRSATIAIGRLGAAAATPEFLSAIVGLLNDKDPIVRDSAAHALGHLGSAAATADILTAILTLIRSNDSRSIEVAKTALTALGSAAATTAFLDELLVLLRDDSFGIQVEALNAVGLLGPAAATPKIINWLRILFGDEESYVRVKVLGALSQLGPAAALPEFLGGLPALLCDSDSFVRMLAAEAVYRFGPVAATPEILAALSFSALLLESDWQARMAKTRAVGQLGPAVTTKFLTDLLALLATGLERYRENPESMWLHSPLAMVETLGPTVVTPDILKVLAAVLRCEPGVGLSDALDAVGSIGPATVTPEIINALADMFLDNYDRNTKSKAAWAMGRLGPAAARLEVICALPDLLEDPIWYVRAAGAQAAFGLGLKAATPEVINELLSLLRDPHWMVPKMAKMALKWFFEQGLRWRLKTQPKWKRTVHELGRI